MVEKTNLTDREIEDLWESFGDIPMDPKTERMEEAFYIWKAGTQREEIWHWFDQHHSKGLVYLLYGVDVSEAKAERLLALDSLCDECDAKDCAYAEDGFCRYPMVRERTPEMADDGQCLGYVFSDSF